MSMQTKKIHLREARMGVPKGNGGNSVGHRQEDRKPVAEVCMTLRFHKMPCDSKISQESVFN